MLERKAAGEDCGSLVLASAWRMIRRGNTHEDQARRVHSTNRYSTRLDRVLVHEPEGQLVQPKQWGTKRLLYRTVGLQ